MNVRQPAGRWTALTMLFLAVSILGLAGAGLCADALIRKTAEKKAISADSCPSPTAAFLKKERKTMTTALQKGILPLIDKTLPAKVGTATFGLG